MLTVNTILAAKVEATPGTAVSPGNADGAMNIYNPKLVPSVAMSHRPRQGGMGELAAIPGARGATLTFQSSLFSAGTDPLWASVLLPACRYVGSSHVYAPVNAPPGTSGVTCCSISTYIDGVLHKLHGCAGNAVMNFVAGEEVLIDWTFMGIWASPTDTSLITPTYPVENVLRFANSTLAVTPSGGSLWSPVVNKLTVDLGNAIILRPDGGGSDASGYRCALATKAVAKGTMDPEKTLVATNPLYANWLASVSSSMTWSLSDGTHAVAFSAPAMQVITPTPGDRDGLASDTIEFQLNPSSGSDELTITLS